MTPLMIIGMVLSFVGVATIIGIVLYYVFLPVSDPFRIFLDATYMGLNYLIYIIVLGAVISGVGLLLYVRAVRTSITIPAGQYSHASYPATTSVIRRPALKKEAPKPSVKEPSKISKPKEPSIVEEIEKEIETIIGSEEKPKEEKIEEEKPAIEIISRASDMVCPHCGKLNPIGSTKCESCGKQMFTPESPSRSCPVCNAPLILSQRISGDLFVCGICFSEIRIPPTIQEVLNMK
ncbi:MAG: zinc ribbon domain-containing protein [Nitrososphaerota archaeon]